ncbi:hypothetical protein PO124_20140 [Bacillus licheniformis]|nr:hypothetical protein [Bacillus licheniformis]
MSGAPRNRHIRYAADGGIYGEASQLLVTRRFNETNGFYERQIAGQPVPEESEVVRDAEKTPSGTISSSFRIPLFTGA